MRPAAVIVVASCAALLVGVAQARDPSPAEIKLNDVDARLGRVEAVVNNQSLLEMARRIDELESQLRALRGAQEESQNGSEALRKQQRDLYADLDKRLGALEQSVKSLQQVPVSQSPDPAVNVATSGGGTGPAGSGSAAGSNAGVLAAAADDQAAYNRAFETLKSGSYFAAIAQWQDFLKTFPRSKLQENAQYWLGESYFVTRDFDNAAAAFKVVIDRFPESPKAADALLKVGYCQFEKKRLPEARTTLKQVQTRYPDSEAARLAGDRLEKMGPATR
jgi:tol-pal system protein YbgF